MTDKQDATPMEENQELQPTAVEQQQEEASPAIDYNELSQEELIAQLTALLATDRIYTVAKEVEIIKSVFYKKLREEKAAQKAAFLEAGGEEESYEANHPIEGQFKSLYGGFKKKKAEYRAEQEKQQERNLKIKKDIIAAIDELVKAEETMKETFEQFRALQEKWRNTGAAAPAYNNDLWQSYHHHVELFYDFISINRELRDLDFKKNLEKKTRLCELAEDLEKEKSLNKAHHELQELHEAWKELGPVEKEHREAIWNRFKEATRVLHKRRNDYFTELKEKNAVAAAKKEEVCQQIEELIAQEQPSSHQGWNQLNERIEELQKEWRALGRLDKVANSQSWNRLREVLNVFYQKKNNFYKERKSALKDELSKKVSICEQAEALQTSTQWKETTEKLIKLQKDWKKTGYVPKHQSDPIWSRFRKACDVFFDSKKNHFEALDKERIANFEKKEAFLKKAEKFKLGEDTQANFDSLQQLSNEWKALGAVPKNKQSLEQNFNKLMDGLYDQLKMDKQEVEKAKYQVKLAGLKTDDFKLKKERQFIQNKITELQKQLQQYETNIEFFGASKGADKLKKQVEKNMDKCRQSIEQWKDKLALLKAL